MSYTRLTLQDFKDKWNADKVKHLEDGISANAIDLDKLFNRNNSLDSDTKKSVQDQLKITNLLDSELVNSFVPLWQTLLSEGGKKIQEPTISFDGNINGKVMIPAPTKGIAQGMLGYVRISDPLAPSILELSPFTSYAMTMGGIGHLLSIMMLSDMEEEKRDTYKWSISYDGGPQSLMGCLFASIGDQKSDEQGLIYQTYESQFQEEFFRLCSTSMTSTTDGDMSTLMFQGREYPTAFSIYRDFEYDGISYPAGFYSIYADLAAAKLMAAQEGSDMNFAPLAAMKNFPLFYVDNVWNLCPINNSNDSVIPDYIRDKSPTNNNNRAYSFDIIGNNKIYWNKKKHGYVNEYSHYDLDNDSIILTKGSICSEPEKFLNALNDATSVTMITNNSDTPIQFTKPQFHFNPLLNSSTISYFQGYSANEFTILVDPMHLVGTNKSILMLPGVIINDDDIIEEFTLEFEGVNIRDMFVKKIDRNVQYFDLTDILPLTTSWTWADGPEGLLEAVESGHPVKFRISGLGSRADVSCLFAYQPDANMYQTVVQQATSQNGNDVLAVLVLNIDADDGSIGGCAYMQPLTQ